MNKLIATGLASTLLLAACSATEEVEISKQEESSFELVYKGDLEARDAFDEYSGVQTVSGTLIYDPESPIFPLIFEADKASSEILPEGRSEIRNFSFNNHEDAVELLTQESACELGFEATASIEIQGYNVLIRETMGSDTTELINILEFGEETCL